MNDDAGTPTVTATAATFEALLGSDFVVHVDAEHQVTAQLTNVTRSTRVMEVEDPRVRQDPFSLIFRVDDGAQLDQRIYKVEHPTNGVMDMFLVPVGVGEYESIFG